MQWCMCFCWRMRTSVVALLNRECTPPRALEYHQVDAQERANVHVRSYYRRNLLVRLNSGHPLSRRDPPLFEDDRPKLFPLGRGEDTLRTGGR